jgi:hypothetical protein
VITTHPWFTHGHYGMGWGWTAASPEGKLLCAGMVVLLLFIRLHWGNTRRTLYFAAATVLVFLLIVMLTTGPG